MSDAKIEFTPEALQEINDAFEWYLERSLPTSEVFVRDLERAFSLISSTPTVWPRFEAGTRRYVLWKFPYDIIYREISEGIEVVAVAHQKRKPRYWRKRLASTRRSSD